MDRAIHDATLSLARDLLARPSVTPDDAGCLAVLEGRLGAAGFVCERLDRNGVGNLWARRGSSAPVVCLAGHVDVVPPGPAEAWTSPPFAPTEREGRLYARGAADMKGPLAAGVTALERVAARAPAAGTIALLVTADEEGDAVDGTAAVVDALRARGERIDHAILAEPTCIHTLGDTIKHGRRGSLDGALTVRGLQSHIAYAESARNPIHLVAPALLELVDTRWDAGDEHFGPTTFQVSNVHAGTGAGNVVPGSLTMRFNFRFSPASTVEDLQGRVRAVLDRHGLDYALEWRLLARPFLTRPGALVDTLSDAVRTITGVAPALSTTGGTSDARFLAALAGEVVEFGGVGASIHQIDEYFPIADLAPLSRVYEATVARLLALAPAGAGRPAQE
jgi:succinyl-diaminopimelate desuccinylase